MKIELELVDAVRPAYQATPQAAPADVRLFQAMVRDEASTHSLLQPVQEYAQSMGVRYEAWRNDWMSLGTKIDLTDPRSAVRMLEQQARLSSQSVQFQFALQSADNVRHAFKSLTQQQA